jgi:hypothetical protein
MRAAIRRRASTPSAAAGKRIGTRARTGFARSTSPHTRTTAHSPSFCSPAAPILTALLDAGAEPSPPADPEDWTPRISALYVRNAEGLRILRERTPPLGLIDAAIDWFDRDFDETRYDRDHPILRSEAVRLLLEAGTPLPWSDETKPHAGS